jgi:DNA-binding beta-propeller fold protein YncE
MERTYRNTALILMLALGLTPQAATSAPEARHYHVAAHWTVGGEGGWDYLTADPVTRRLYVTHSTGVEVLDLDRGTAVGRVGPTPGVHGVALAPELGRGFVSCGRDSSVIVFDLKTLATLTRVALPARNPDAILFEPTRRRVFAFNGGSGSASVIDAARGTLDTTLDLGGRPEFAVADGRGHVYVNLEDRSELLAIDAATLAILRRWSLAPGEEPSGLALDAAHHRLYSACSNHTLVVSDADSGRVIGSAPIGAGVDGVVYDATRGAAITTNGEGTITVVRANGHDGFEAAETDSTRRGARTGALDSTSGRVFTVTANFGPPPEPTAERPHPRPTVLPGTFEVLVLEP